MSRLTFLDLPENVRLKIYELTAPIPERVISLNGIRGAKAGLDNLIDCTGQPEYFLVADCFKDFWRREGGIRSLFHTCRSVYLEGSRLVYSKLVVGIRNSEPGSINRLSSLAPRLVQCLTNLTIRLNDPAPYQAQDMSEDAYDEHVHQKLYLDAASGPDMDTVLRWRRCARSLFSQVTPFALTLNFICDTQFDKIAYLATEPFFEIQSPLEACNIRLSHLPIQDYHMLAKRASFWATGSQAKLSSPKSPFRFMYLPKEIRLQILQYTDLVTPLCEVEWKRNYGFHVHYGKAYPRKGRNYSRSWARISCENKTQNGIFFEYSNQGEYMHKHLEHRHIHCAARSCSRHPFTGCFCPRYHGAYTADCKCWVPPTAFFLVCRGLYQDSIETFYSKNRLVMTPEGDVHQPAGISTRGALIETFLKNIVPQRGRAFIRRLQVVFPPFSYRYSSHTFCEICEHLPKPTLSSVSREFEPLYQNWLRALSIMRTDVLLPALKLEVHVAEWHITHVRDETYFSYRRNLAEEEGRAVEKAYIQVFESLVQLKGLKDLFVFLDWPWSGKSVTTHWHSNRRAQFYNPELRSTNTIEKQLECLVMGEHYDSAMRGKSDELDNIGWRYACGDRSDTYPRPWGPNQR